MDNKQIWSLHEQLIPGFSLSCTTPKNKVPIL